MPSSDGSDGKQARNQNPNTTHPPPKVTDSLPCPRCDSTTTKFCYYNNYNLSQPRHFCKACRRYWTQGGTLRNIPVGGGTRKNSKRTRNSSSSSAACGGGGCAATTNSSTCSSTLTHEHVTVTGAHHVSVLPCVNPGMVSVMTTDHVNLNEGFPVSGNFTNTLGMQVQGQNFLGLGGYHGYGMGSGIEELELGFGGTRGWEIAGDAGYGGGVGATAASGCNTWQMMNDDEGGNGAGLVGEDCFGWPGLAISTPGGKGLK